MEDSRDINGRKQDRGFTASILDSVTKFDSDGLIRRELSNFCAQFEFAPYSKFPH